MNPVRVAVVGCGHMGTLHAQKLAQLPQARLVAVVDPDPRARQQTAEKCGAAPLADFRHLFLEPLDAAVIAVPTSLHFRVASEFLARGIPVLVEKPLAHDVESAAALVDLAAAKGVILQVGHIERYNPAFEWAAACCHDPLFISSLRCGKLAPRTIPCDVVTDLLIHDLDLLAWLVRTPVINIEVFGWTLLGPSVDFAQVRLRFDRGTIAVCTASRISGALPRRMEILEPDRYFEIDFANRRLLVREKRKQLCPPAGEAEAIGTLAEGPSAVELLNHYFPQSTYEFPGADPLTAELVDFLEAVRESRPPRVDGRQALQVLSLAHAIREQIVRQLAEPCALAEAPQFTTVVPSWLKGPHWERRRDESVPVRPITSSEDRPSLDNRLS